LGGKPLLPWLALIDSISDKASLVPAVSMLKKHKMNSMFSWWIDTDPRNMTQKLFAIAPPDISLPDKTYYLEDTQEMMKHRGTYTRVISKMFEPSGYSHQEARSRSAQILSFETRVASLRADKADARKDHGSATTWEELHNRGCSCFNSHL
jgi:predicted metalloendopeptidase